MSDDRRLDTQHETPAPEGAESPAPAAEAAEARADTPAEPATPVETRPADAEPPRPATTARPRPLPPTWLDLSPEDVERLTKQVERAFSSEPFMPLAQASGGGRPARAEARRAEPEAPAAGALEAAAEEEAAAEVRPAEEREAGRRRRRGSRGRGRRRRREGAALAPVSDLDLTGDVEVSFAEAGAVPPAPAEAAAEAAAVVEAAAKAEVAEEAAEGGEGQRGRRRRGRRGREREERRAAEPSPAAPPAEDEPELRVLEEALRAGQPRSAADIGAFDEREQALLKDSWPDAPVREGQGPMRRRSQHGLSMEETFEARREKMHEERLARKGTLYVVATPIGNLEDITFRAVRVLKEVKLIAAEDTRQTAKLLNHYQVRTPLTSFFEHNEPLKIEPLLRRLDDGQAIALVSDAGTPGISDPGYSLVKAAVERGATVVSVPGACAAVAALSASGLPTDAWAFVGFLPQKEKKRREILESLKLDRRTLIFYESPGRTYETIQDLCDVLGNRDLVMFREMTKMHEECVRGKFSKILAEYRGKEIKGEVVLVVAGWQGKLADREGLSILDRLRLYKQESGLPLADVVRLVARETGTPKSEVYRESLKLVGVDLDKIRAKAERPAAEAAERPAEAVEAPSPAEEAAGAPEPEAEVVNGGRPPVVLTDTAAASEPDLIAEPDAQDRKSVV